ncbi:MAG: hypothetical protein QOH76_2529 [Thermoleophilaceae bacterium]|jgi:hypothetical protein|nr:hypothetical protein [Thermoleophilaceae bacterium]
MKRNLAIGIAALAATIGASVAEAAVQKGAFRGKTEAKDPVGFRVPVKDRVSDFYLVAVRLTCSDGDAFDTDKSAAGRLRSDPGVRYKVNSKRKFTIVYTNKSAGNGWTVHGKFGAGGNMAGGTLKVYANFNKENKPAPNGSIHCKSKTLKWTAKRK